MNVWHAADVPPRGRFITWHELLTLMDRAVEDMLVDGDLEPYDLHEVGLELEVRAQRLYDTAEARGLKRRFEQ